MRASQYRLEADLEGGFHWDLVILARDISWVAMWLDGDKPFTKVTITLLQKDSIEVADSFGARQLSGEVSKDD